LIVQLNPQSDPPQHPRFEWNKSESNLFANGIPYIGNNAVLEVVFSRPGAIFEYYGIPDIEFHGLSSNKALVPLRYDVKVEVPVNTII